MRRWSPRSVLPPASLPYGAAAHRLGHSASHRAEHAARQGSGTRLVSETRGTARTRRCSQRGGRQCAAARLERACPHAPISVRSRDPRIDDNATEKIEVIGRERPAVEASGCVHGPSVRIRVVAVLRRSGLGSDRRCYRGGQVTPPRARSAHVVSRVTFQVWSTNTTRPIRLGISGIE
jgi:hypothetical protein